MEGRERKRKGEGQGFGKEEREGYESPPKKSCVRAWGLHSYYRTMHQLL
jgi:hypothetical protein